jgi:superfamily II DNA or RNA helicase
MLRDYQERAVEAAKDSLAQNRSCLLVAATGVGKTTIFCEIIRRALEKGNRIVVMAHRDELIQQAKARIEHQTGVQAEVEKAESWASDDARVVVTSVQTMNAKWFEKKRLERFPPDEFALLIIDEAHHACARSYINVIDHFQQNQSLRLIGVTATPDRGDEIGLGNIFDDAPFVYEIGDAVRDGWLVPIRQKYVTVGSLDYSEMCV